MSNNVLGEEREKGPSGGKLVQKRKGLCETGSMGRWMEGRKDRWIDGWVDRLADV